MAETFQFKKRTDKTIIFKYTPKLLLSNLGGNLSRI